MRRALVTYCFVAFGLLLSVITIVESFVPNGRKWPSATSTFNVDIPGDDGLWNTAFEEAMGRWNNATVFDYRINQNTFEDPCDREDGYFRQNGVGFSDTTCRDAFGTHTLAVTVSIFRSNELLETNIIFNTAKHWGVYDGRYKSGRWLGINDFRRVAVHELGHALGLTHEDGVPAIMTPTQTTGNTIIAPTADDIAGVAALYQAGLRPRAPTLTKPAHWASEVSLNPSLAWNPESRATSYDVYFGTHINPPFVGNTSDHYYSPGPLISNVTYFWYVAARNSFGPTPSEFWRSFTTIEPVDETARTRHVFPQFADGQGWLSLVVTTNASLEDAECTISSYGVDINRFIELPDLDKGITSATYPVSSFGGISVLATTGTASLQTGYITVNCTQPVTAQVLYLSKTSNVTTGFATVFSSQPGTLFTTYLLQSPGARLRLGVAIANDDVLATSCTVSIADLAGSLIGEANLTISGRTSIARFADELVPSLPPGVFSGSLSLLCTRPVSTIGLQFDGIVFTTVPLTVLLP